MKFNSKWIYKVDLQVHIQFLQVFSLREPKLQTTCLYENVCETYLSLGTESFLN